MAGALFEDFIIDEKLCANCTVFDWKQPDKDILRRCSGCTTVWYCDDKCQKEHWHHTHKRQCKYISKKKVLSQANHEEPTCLMCKEEVRVGKDEMSKQSNPMLPCTMSRANKELMKINESFSVGLPYAALAEMTGVFHTKVEATIVTFMRILVKMKMTKHLLWQVPRTAALADSMYKLLWQGRMDYLANALTLKKPGPLDGQFAFERINLGLLHDFIEMVFAVDDIGLPGTGEEFPSPFKPWEIIKVLTAVLFGGVFSIQMHAADCVGIAGLPEEIARVRTTSVQYYKMRDKVLSLLSAGLVPFTTFTSIVLDGLCDGNHVQHCNVCREEVTVSKAVVGYVSHVPPGDPVLVLGSDVTYTLCGRETCFDQTSLDTFEAGRKELREVYKRLLGEHMKELCDYCGKLNHKARGLRCERCLTKLYCGVECQVKDSYHLQTKCEKGEKRKKKRSDSRRKEEGVKIIMELYGKE